MVAKLSNRKDKKTSAFKRLVVSLEKPMCITKASIQEFSKNVEESAVYKLIGPVLLKQDPAEATLAVDARLDFIRKEMSVL